MILNSEIATFLKEEFGDEKFKIYCEMQIIRSKVELADEVKNGPKDFDRCMDASYEVHFWESKLNELKS